MKRHLLFLLACIAIGGASGRAEEGMPADSACLDYLKQYIGGEKGLHVPCEEGHYEWLMSPVNECSKTVKERTKRAHAVCMATKATQRDYDNCNQSEIFEIARAGCVAIINDKSQSPADRAAAYIQQGNILMKDRHHYSAIDSYDRALKLEPRNALAFAARAIAHWKEADVEKEREYLDWERNERLKAVADFRRATEIDATQTKEMTAASPDLQQISAMTAKGVPPLPRGWRAPPRGG